ANKYKFLLDYYNLPYPDFTISSYEGTKSAKGFMDNTEKQPSTFDIYPNPATDYFTILTDTENSSVQIFNMNGQIMFDETVSNNLLRVNCDHYKTGVYLVVVINENGKMYKRKLIVY
ncbi:MAG: T9SS type A sorting domain-containing protein, partial [Bacteroidota bacterium]